MTDKKCIGIDCAWCANPECPNEKKEDKMTDKEIIIDGVNVRLCENFCRTDNRNNPNMCYSYMNESYTRCNPAERFCSFYTQSLQDQLQREKQKNKELEIELSLRKQHNEEQLEAISSKTKLYNKTVDKYKKALKEIGEIVKEQENKTILTFSDMDLKQNAKVIMGQCNGGYIQILQKVKEVTE